MLYLCIAAAGVRHFACQKAGDTLVEACVGMCKLAGSAMRVELLQDGLHMFIWTLKALARVYWLLML